MNSAFLALRNSTKCPFAKRAVVVESPTWEPDRTFEENVQGHAVAIRAMSTRIEQERLDGFVAYVRTPSDSPSFDEVKFQFRRYLFALAETDSSCAIAMAGDFQSPEWQFTHSDVRFFLNVFAACYPEPHSKFAPVAGGFLVFFQPEQSFSFCPGPPLDRFKHVIRQRFSLANMPYNGERIDRRIEAPLYIFPVEPFGEDIRWWEDQPV